MNRTFNTPCHNKVLFGNRGGYTPLLFLQGAIKLYKSEAKLFYHPFQCGGKAPLVRDVKPLRILGKLANQVDPAPKK
jgi:hypothetical protein